MVEVAVVVVGKQVHCFPNPSEQEFAQAYWVLLPNGSYTGCKPSARAWRKARKLQAKFTG